MSDETMTRTVKIHQKLASVFEPEQSQVLSEVVTEAFQDLVKTSDFSELKAIVGLLAQAQHRTEQRVEELATNLNILTKTVAQLARQVGGLSDTVGGDVEDIAQFMITQVLKNELGWRVHTLERSWHTWGAKLEEIDLFGRATDPTRPELRFAS